MTEARGSRGTTTVVLACATAAVLGGGAVLQRRAAGRVTSAAIAAAPKGVTVVEAKTVSYRPSRRYVGTTEPWLRARIGPQLVSAYVDTVLVRPGAIVKKGEVLATLDCRTSSAHSQAIALAARALAAKQVALAHEAARLQGLVSGGFVAVNEAEKKAADSAAQQAELLSTQAKLVGSALEVDDCAMRAPFDGVVETRSVYPGAFVKPGTTLLSIIDRSTVRVVVDVPEVDFLVVPPGSKVTVSALALDLVLEAKIDRRAPAADPSTRTVHCEVDVYDPTRRIPVGTTATVTLAVGEAMETTKLPLVAASIRGEKATTFIVSGGIAHSASAKVVGEAAGFIFVQGLAAGALVVTEGRSTLVEGDAVVAKTAS